VFALSNCKHFAVSCPILIKMALLRSAILKRFKDLGKIEAGRREWDKKLRNVLSAIDNHNCKHVVNFNCANENLFIIKLLQQKSVNDLY